jgi:phage tail sheath gpL-like
MDGLAITSMSGTFSRTRRSVAVATALTRVIMAQPGAVPLTPPMEFAAETAALVALATAQADPARPFQTLAYARAIAPAETDQLDVDERNLFLFDGISTTKRVAGGGVQLERLITTYQTSAVGRRRHRLPRRDDARFTLMYLRYSGARACRTRYPRHKLANDGTRFGSGQAVMTPKLGKAEAITWFREMEELGLVEGFDQFKRDLVCERNADPNRLDFLLPPDLINALQVIATQFKFRL